MSEEKSKVEEKHPSEDIEASEREDANEADAGASEGEATAPKGDPPWRLVLVLTLVCAAAGAALAGAHELTKGPIKKAQYRFKLASVKEVLPECDEDPGKNTVEVEVPGHGKITVYRCVVGGKIAAVAFSLDTKKNKNPTYSGLIEVLVGVTQGGRVVASKKDNKVGVLILKHSETPGLGAKIEGESFLSSFRDESFLGRNLAENGESCGKGGRCHTWAVKKDDSRGFVDAISGATISSRAVTEVVQRALTVFNDKKVRAQMLEKKR